ncbi:MAG: sigma-70 family RNA polymerase sigma factor [Clostridiales bacterium]|nr:sigma-70 family RNA polymerase sigma factor [Clostridiales bacterium]
MFFAAIEVIEHPDDRTFMLELYHRYYRYVRKTIYGLTKDITDIEDLISDVFIRLIEKIPVLRTLTGCKTTSYVVYTARSVAINYIKHKYVERKHLYYGKDMDISDRISDDGNVEGKLFHESDLELLGRAIAKLPQRQKDLLHFKYELEMNDKDIAEIMGIESNSVRQYLTRARRNAKKLAETEMAGDEQ